MDQRQGIKVTRQELYDQIWSTPISRACLVYGLSDVGLAKICAEWDILRPPRCYWAKKRNGKPIRRRKMRPLAEGNPVVLTYRPSPPDQAEADCPPTQSDRQRLFENRPENCIAVLEQLTEPHPLIAATERSIRSARPGEDGMSRPKARRCLDLVVSPASIDRSLRILDALLKALEARGLPVTVGDGDRPRVQARVLDEDIGFQLHEEAARQEREPTREEREWELRWHPERKFYVREPSGKLVLRITDGQGLRRCWTDRSDRRVEQFLNSFVVGLVRAAESVKQERIDSEERRKRWEEAERCRREEEGRWREAERRRQEEEARFRRLEAQVEAWGKAQQIRAFLAAVRDAASGGEVVPGSELDQWLKWAEGRANALDPLKRPSEPASQ